MRSGITLLLMLLIASLKSVAQGGTVTGTITDEHNHGIRAAIMLIDSGKVKYATLADASGNFTVKGIKAGRYDLKATSVSFRESVRKGVMISDGQTQRVNLQLSHALAQKDDSKEKELIPPPPPAYKKHLEISGNTGAAEKSVSYGAPVTVDRYTPPVFYTPSTESYKKNPENDFMNVKVNPLSTMSVDVDRASYSNVRRFLNDGQRPPADAVRVEEMINYFDYDYQQPQADDPIAIHTELTDCPWQPGHKLLHIGIQAKKINTEKLPPSNLVFLVDVSGSMESAERLPLLVAGMKLLVQNLRASDKVTIVTYAGNAGLVLPPTSGNNKQRILDALDKLEAGGSTAGGAGIRLAYKMATENFIKGGNNRVLLATDGDFNVGISNENELEDLIVKERESGVFLTCLGLGTGNYKDSKMELLADKGNGNYDYIDNIQEAQKTLVSEFGGTLFTVAKDVKAQIEFNPTKVQGYRLVGYENRVLNNEDFKDDKKDAGDMGSGHTVTIMYEIIPVGVVSKYMRDANDLKYQSPIHTEATYTDELATIKFRYKQPDGDKSKEMVQTIKDITTNLVSASENSRFSTSVAMFGMLLRDSRYKGTSSYEGVLAIAEASRSFDKEGYRAEFIRLVKAARGSRPAGGTE